jgi:hypothetical protein
VARWCAQRRKIIYVSVYGTLLSRPSGCDSCIFVSGPISFSRRWRDLDIARQESRRRVVLAAGTATSRINAVSSILSDRCCAVYAHPAGDCLDGIPSTKLPPRSEIWDASSQKSATIVVGGRVSDRRGDNALNMRFGMCVHSNFPPCMRPASPRKKIYPLT